MAMLHKVRGTGSARKKKDVDTFSSKTYDQNGFFQIITDLIHVNYDEMWQEHYIPAEHKHTDDDTLSDGRKRRRHELQDSTESTMPASDEDVVMEEAKKKRRRTLSGSYTSAFYQQTQADERIDAIDK